MEGAQEEGPKHISEASDDYYGPRKLRLPTSHQGTQMKGGLFRTLGARRPRGPQAWGWGQGRVRYSGLSSPRLYREDSLALIRGKDAVITLVHELGGKDFPWGVWWGSWRFAHESFARQRGHNSKYICVHIERLMGVCVLPTLIQKRL